MSTPPLSRYTTRQKVSVALYFSRRVLYSFFFVAKRGGAESRHLLASVRFTLHTVNQYITGDDTRHHFLQKNLYQHEKIVDLLKAYDAFTANTHKASLYWTVETQQMFQRPPILQTK